MKLPTNCMSFVHFATQTTLIDAQFIERTQQSDRRRNRAKHDSVSGQNCMNSRGCLCKTCMRRLFCSTGPRTPVLLLTHKPLFDSGGRRLMLCSSSYTISTHVVQETRRCVLCRAPKVIKRCRTESARRREHATKYHESMQLSCPNTWFNAVSMGTNRKAIATTKSCN